MGELMFAHSLFYCRDLLKCGLKILFLFLVQPIKQEMIIDRGNA